MVRRTGFIWHEAYAWYELGNDAGVVPPDGRGVQPDRNAYDPEIPRRMRNLLEMSGLLEDLVHLKPSMATEEDIRRVHTREHVDQIRTLSALVTGGDAGNYSPIPRGTFDAALLAAGGALTAVDAVMNGEVDNAYALVRPAGHHATPKQSMGFCVFSNAAIAGRHLLESHGLERIAYVDWDVHHGNGTQDCFYAEENVYFMSSHRDPFYPGTGARTETGTAAGLGTIFNLPTSFGITRRRFIDNFRGRLEQAADACQPELVLISAGFDAHKDDPIGSLGLESEDFATLTDIVMGIAHIHCGGRVVSLLEGGYNVDRLAESVEFHLRRLNPIA